MKFLLDCGVFCCYGLGPVLVGVLRLFVAFQKLHSGLVARAYLQVGFPWYFFFYLY